MPRILLERQNVGLLRQFETLLDLLTPALAVSELRPYHDRVMHLCVEARNDVRRNLELLGLHEDSILNDVLSRTFQATQKIRLISSMWAIPILRAQESDRLCLRTIGWLHRSHAESAHYPAVFINGNCAIRPYHDLAPMYVFPALEQQGLLYLPLLFHEFGHFLYRCHKLEMDDLVLELQYTIDDLLMPASQRNDRFAEAMTAQRQTIANTWYAWTQELFCDAVGFAIGGPGYVQAFSNFLVTMDYGGLYRKPRLLENSTHPVTWLRVHFLARRVMQAGYVDLAIQIEDEWRALAQLSGIAEDYHGFYHESLDEAITQAIEDMLIEASPRQCSAEEASGEQWLPGHDSLVRLLNWAWRVYTANVAGYSQWEREQIAQVLSCEPTVYAIHFSASVVST